jgi:hypothetical protein
LIGEHLAEATLGQILELATRIISGDDRDAG